MSIQKKMYKASFRGVSFLTSGEITTNGGRKIVMHDYINSDRRSSEDLGKMRKDFSIDAIISDRNNSYKDDIKSLVDALEQAGSGLFMHPFLGKFEVISQSYTLSENPKQPGRGVFTLRFSEVDPSIYPKESDTVNMGWLLKSLQAANRAFLENNFIVSFSKNIASATAMVGDVVDKIEEIQDTVDSVTSRVSAITKSIADIRNKINSLVNDVATMGIALTNLFDNVSSISSNPLASVGLFKKMFGFSTSPRMAYSAVLIMGLATEDSTSVRILPTTIKNRKDTIKESDSQTLVPLTAARVENISNANTINLFVNIECLGQSYYLTSQNIFENQDELESISNSLEAQFSDISKYIDGEILNALSSMRDEWNKIQEKQITTVDKIIEISVDNQPLVQICYDLYGSTDNYDKIINLNNIVNPANINGTIKVLSI